MNGNEAPEAMMPATLNGHVLIPVDQFEAHMKRVEIVFALVKSVLAGLADSPMAPALLGPDVIRQLREIDV